MKKSIVVSILAIIYFIEWSYFANNSVLTGRSYEINEVFVTLDQAENQLELEGN